MKGDPRPLHFLHACPHQVPWQASHAQFLTLSRLSSFPPHPSLQASRGSTRSSPPLSISSAYYGPPATALPHAALFLLPPFHQHQPTSTSMARLSLSSVLYSGLLFSSLLLGHVSAESTGALRGGNSTTTRALAPAQVRQKKGREGGEGGLSRAIGGEKWREEMNA